MARTMWARIMVERRRAWGEVRALRREKRVIQRKRMPRSDTLEVVDSSNWGMVLVAYQ